MNAEERSSVVSPEPTELDQALANIIEMEEVASTSQKFDEAVVKEKEDTDKQKAGSMRKMAMEKLGETQKREVEEGEQENHMKKKRSGNETISFLREKADSEKALREEELAIRRKQRELEEKKLAPYLDHEKSMMELTHHQQQSQILMAVVDKLMNKKS